MEKVGVLWKKILLGLGFCGCAGGEIDEWEKEGTTCPPFNFSCSFHSR